MTFIGTALIEPAPFVSTIGRAAREEFDSALRALGPFRTLFLAESFLAESFLTRSVLCGAVLRGTILTFAGSIPFPARSETFASESAVSPTATTAATATATAPFSELAAPLTLLARALIAVAPFTVAGTGRAIARTLFTKRTPVAEVARVSLGPFAAIRAGVVLRRISATRGGPLFTRRISASPATPERTPLATASIPLLAFRSTLTVRALFALAIGRPFRRNIGVEVERFPLEPLAVVQVLDANWRFGL